MKKVILSAVASSLLVAADLPYNIFVGSYSNSSDSAIKPLLKRVQDGLDGKNYADSIKVLDRSSGKYHVVVVETKPMSNAMAKSILRDVKSIKGDAYMMVNKEGSSFETASYNNSEDMGSNLSEDPVVVTSVVEEVANPVTTDMPVASVSQVVTLNDAVKRLLAENPLFQERVSNYMKVGKDTQIANAAYYPVLDVTGSYGTEHRRHRGPDGNRDGSGEVGQIGVVLTGNIYNGGADANRIDQENARLNSAAYDVAQQADRLSLKMVEAYLEVLKNKQLFDISTESVKSHQNIYEQIKSRTDSGFGRISEEKQAGSRLSLAQTNLLSQQNDYEASLATFNKLYGEIVQPSNLTTPVFELDLPNTEEEVYNIAMRCNPAVLLQDSNIKIAEFGYEGTSAAFKPKIDFEASASYGEDDVYGARSKDERYAALLKLRYNLYNKGADKLTREKAQVNIQSEQQNMDSVKRDLVESLKFSWQTYVLTQKKMDYINNHLEYAQSTLSTYADEFRLGRRDLINLLDAETEYYNAVKEKINAEHDLLFSKYRLLDNMGVLADSFESGFSKKYIQGVCSLAQTSK